MPPRWGAFSDIVWGIDFAPDGTLYGAAFEIFTIDPANAQILTTADISEFIVELDYALDGTIYGVDANRDDLYTIDPVTGGLTLVGTYPSDSRERSYKRGLSNFARRFER